MRQRLTTRVAEDLTVKSKGESKESKGSGIDNDVYNMNDTGHEKNDPDREEYAKGDPSAWAEDVHTKKVNTDDSKREETGHAPLVDKHAASEAIATVRVLEEKAARCIVASQRALPGADRDMIEAQAASFMHLPDSELNATLSRQEKLARMIAGAAEESAKEVEEVKEDVKPEEPAKEAAKECEVKKDDAEEVEAAKKEEKKEEDIPAFLQKKLASLEAEIEALKTAAAKGVSSVNTNDTEMNITNAAEEPKEEKKDVEEVKEAKEEKKDEEPKEDKDDDEVTFGDDDEEEGKEASEDNLLNQIFSTVTASADKKGAKTLAGLVKKEASSTGTNLDSILMDGVPPDVNHLFQ